jgi:16S rRNA (guanine966-N2)-methyltransferase
MKNNFINTQITGGRYRSRTVKSPMSEATHPMGSRERLAIMNSLAPVLEDAVVLDLYAGTGALGIEALSRGAKSVVFVEKNHKVAAILKENLKTFGVEPDVAEVYENDVAKVDLNNKNFDVVLIDPPYDKFDEFEKCFSEIFANVIKNAPKIVISHSKSTEVSFPELEDYKKTDKTFAGAGIATFTK